jgi:hypothetical protein
MMALAMTVAFPPAAGEATTRLRSAKCLSAVERTAVERDQVAVRRVSGKPDVATRLGPSTCIHVVLDAEYERDPEATRRAKREVGEIRAGTRPMPGVDEAVNPVGTRRKPR